MPQKRFLLLSFLSRFTNKTNLWDSLISTATGVFTTQEGYDMVSRLYVQHQGEFGSAEHIIEKVFRAFLNLSSSTNFPSLQSLRNIKEETKWTNENLPVIEKWLDNFQSHIQKSENNKFMG